MVKISIELDDIINGDKLRATIVKELESRGILLPERHAGLYLDDMAETVSINRKENQTEIKIKCSGILYHLNIQNLEDNTLRAGLTCLYGYGHIKYDYGLPIFQSIDKEGIKKYMELALEIWERNIHLNWMRKCGYKTHNGTKDELFLYQMIEKDIETMKKTHWERSEHREKDDTPHHMFRDINLLRRIMEREGEHELSKYLIESLYDQATATSRIWYTERHLPFEERLVKNRDEGYYVNQDFRWKPGAFGFTNDYETKTWQLWLKVHDEFKEYWLNKFGHNEELWQPPAPMKVLKNKGKI